jgi:hypothetical protein
MAIAAGGQDVPLAYSPSPSKAYMLETLAVVLIALWLLGLFSSYTLGGFIHLLLVLGIIAILLKFVRGARP